MKKNNILNQKCAKNIINSLIYKKYFAHKIVFPNEEIAMSNLIEIQKLVGDKFKHELFWTNMESGEMCYRFTLKLK